jgi:response regulator of citrate/malate metabolism
MRRRAAWQVLIVEDDPHIGAMYAHTLRSLPSFEAAGTVSSGEDALNFLRRYRCDLLLLDLELDGMDGLALMQRLRRDGHRVEIIVLTASRSAGAVRTAIHHGAIDYLVKPFDLERLRQSLGLFLNRVATPADPEALSQASIDRMVSGGRVPRRWLPKGLTHPGIEKVRAALDDDRGLCSSAIAESTGLARVTARRYLEYLVATDQASVFTAPTGPGRPRKLYRAVNRVPATVRSCRPPRRPDRRRGRQRSSGADDAA